MTLARRFGGFAAVALAVGLVACGDSGASGEGSGSGTSSSALMFHAEIAPLADFSYDTGLLPEASPAQVSLKLSAGGGVKIDVAAEHGGSGLAGKPGGGKLAIDLHLKMEGRLKVTSAFKDYDGEIPGLANIDIPILASAPFDGLLMGDSDIAEAKADLPETTLPEIPLGSIPGSLVLTVSKGSVLTTQLHGTCLSVAGGQATYAGESITGGTLVLAAKIVLKLPTPLNKTVDLPAITVAIPQVKSKVEGGVAAPGIADSATGACGATSSQDKQTSGGAPGSGSGAGNDTSNDPAPTDDTSCKKLTCLDYFGQCGDHDDTCGGSIHCGQCAPACTPKTCAQLGKTCGTAPDGCGGVASCGVCPAPCSDAYEPNNDKNNAKSLGYMSDAPNSVKSISAALGDGDEDWYRVAVHDEGFDGNPSVIAAVSGNHEVAVFYSCTNGGDASYCAEGSTQDNSFGKGCRGAKSATLYTSCDGLADSGTAFIRVRKTASDAQCTPYSLSLNVE